MIIEKGTEISIEDVSRTAIHGEIIELAESAVSSIETAHQRLIRIAGSGKPVYGINTGFGIFANKKINDAETLQLNRNLILSHAVGTGKPLDERIVRASMFIRAVTLAKGYSGVRPVIIKTLLDMLNKGVVPIIPEKGSLGSSGDLCQLSHLALVLSTDLADLEEESGKAKFKGKVLSGKQAMSDAGINRIVLTTKEGLALNNGATFSAAIAALSIYEAEYLLHVAEIAAALSMEALCARSIAFDDRVHQARKQIGQIKTAKTIRELTNGSTFIDSLNQVQDAYSIRCMPQIVGAIRDTHTYVKSIIEREINAATDNPLIFEPEDAISGGNFHGEPIGLVCDYLSIALCELGAVSERRTYRLTDENTNNGLPPMLVDNPRSAGLNSGLMMPQYTAASLVLENQTLATPDSIRSLPTSASQEDHNANAMTAARHTYEIILNLRQILSIELYTAVRGIELRRRVSKGNLGVGTTEAYDKISQVVTYKDNDTLWGHEIQKINEMIEKRIL